MKQLTGALICNIQINRSDKVCIYSLSIILHGFIALKKSAKTAVCLILYGLFTHGFDTRVYGVIPM